jgi:metal-sulfur cluster biosynthetic enzyme
VSEALVAKAYAALEEVLDPEYPVGIVSMGLVRGVAVTGGVADIKLTFTSMGCPWTDWIERGITEKLLAVEGIREVKIEVVWDKPWTRKDIAPTAKLVFMKMGISP